MNTPSTSAPHLAHAATLRDVVTSICRERFPTVNFKNDYYLFILSEMDNHMVRSFSSDEDVYIFVDLLFHWETRGREDLAQALLDCIGDMFEAPDDHMGGVKPPPGFNHSWPGVFFLPIPHSGFSVRLFPGSSAGDAYLFDFVHSATGNPVNSPFEFELWVSPGPGYNKIRLGSIEGAVGIAPRDIFPGAETFSVRKGFTCALRRPGHKDMVFKMPKLGAPGGHYSSELEYRPCLSVA